MTSFAHAFFGDNLELSLSVISYPQELSGIEYLSTVQPFLSNVAY